MPFTRTWDATYEAIPADSMLAKLYADEVRKYKIDVRERMDIEHSWGSGGDGRHKIALVADAAARDALFTSPLDGNLCFLQDVQTLQIRSGGVWLFSSARTARGYLFGYTLSRTATVDITIAPGALRSSDDAATINLGSNLVKKIDAAWTAGSGVGGRAGTLTNGTWYHVFVIYNPTTQVTDAGFDTSLTATALLALATGFTKYRRVGSVFYIDGVSFIRDFIQQKDRFYWKSPPALDFNSAIATGAGGTTLTLSVPTGFSVLALLNVHITNTASDLAQVYFSSPLVTDDAPSATVSPLLSLGNDANSPKISAQVEVLTNTTRQIRGRSTNASNTTRVATLGWIDPLGE